MPSNHAPLEEIKRCGRWNSDPIKAYLNGDTLLLRGLSSEIVDGRNLLGEVRFPNSHRSRQIPPMNQRQQPSIAAGDLDRCVGCANSCPILGAPPPLAAQRN